MSEHQSGVPNHRLPPGGLEHSMLGVGRRTQLALSPWVQRSLVAASLTGRHRTNGVSLSSAYSHRLLRRIQRFVDRTAAVNVNLGSVEPDMISRFSSRISVRFDTLARKHEQGSATHADTQGALDMPLAEGASMTEPSVETTGTLSEGYTPQFPTPESAGPFVQRSPSRDRSSTTESEEVPTVRQPMPSMQQVREAVNRYRQNPQQSVTQSPSSTQTLSPQPPPVIARAAHPTISRVRSLSRVEEIDPLAIAERNAQGETRPTQQETATPSTREDAQASIQRKTESAVSRLNPSTSLPAQDESQPVQEKAATEEQAEKINASSTPLQRMRRARSEQLQRTSIKSQTHPPEDTDRGTAAVIPVRQTPEKSPVIRRESVRDVLPVSPPAQVDSHVPVDYASQEQESIRPPISSPPELSQTSLPVSGEVQRKVSESSVETPSDQLPPSPGEPSPLLPPSSTILQREYHVDRVESAEPPQVNEPETTRSQTQVHSDIPIQRSVQESLPDAGAGIRMSDPTSRVVDLPTKSDSVQRTSTAETTSTHRQADATINVPTEIVDVNEPGSSTSPAQSFIERTIKRTESISRMPLTGHLPAGKTSQQGRSDATTVRQPRTPQIQRELAATHRPISQALSVIPSSLQQPLVQRRPRNPDVTSRTEVVSERPVLSVPEAVAELPEVQAGSMEKLAQAPPQSPALTPSITQRKSAAGKLQSTIPLVLPQVRDAISDQVSPEQFHPTLVKTNESLIHRRTAPDMARVNPASISLMPLVQRKIAKEQRAQASSDSSVERNIDQVFPSESGTTMIMRKSAALSSTELMRTNAAPVSSPGSGQITTGRSQTGVIQRDTNETGEGSEQTTSVPAPPDLDQLARDVLPHVKRMLAVERERLIGR